MPEMHLEQPGFTYSARGSFTRNKERIETFLQTSNTDCIYRSELDTACIQHMAYGKSKDLTKWTQSDKNLRDKEFKIASHPKYDGYQRGLVYMFFDKKSSEKMLTLNQIINVQVNFIGKFLQNLRDEKFIHHLETIFGVLI